LIAWSDIFFWRNNNGRRQFNYLSVGASSVEIADEKYCADCHAEI
jgi:hypothetical protein